MEAVINPLAHNFRQMANVQLFHNFRTGNAIVDTILSSIAVTLLGMIVHHCSTFPKGILIHLNFRTIRFYLCKKNCIVLEGKKTNRMSVFNDSYSISTAYSNRFKAMWEYILQNLETNRDIYQVKEIYSNYSLASDKKYKSKEQFVVFQNRHFQIAKDVFVFAEFDKEEIDSEENARVNKTARIEKIIVNVYSYKLSLAELMAFTDSITTAHLSKIQSSREDKRFIYTLMTTTPPNNEYSDDINWFACWKETLYESCKTFDNIFFDGKRDILKRIDFFLSNKQWYEHKGIPHTLGIGLQGPPGTGKTSFIKALGNYTKRHLIVLSFKLIKTKRQLDQFFFENRYNSNNEPESIAFNNKIIVFEDIDCIGDIILEREHRTPSSLSSTVRTSGKTIKLSKDNDGETVIDLEQKEDDALTLDDILNLWDGIRETPGRILIITSNHYAKLDAALVRPGRIDITHEFSNASHGTISEIYTHLFERNIDMEKLAKVEENVFSPAEILNNYVANKDESAFMEYLMQNKKKIK